jgi:hypothetical protein
MIVFVIDLSLLANRCQTVKDAHIFFLINALCLTLIVFDEIATLLFYVNWVCIGIMTIGSSFGLYSMSTLNSSALNMLRTWQYFVLPFVV